tara:strand:- start:274 stop:606 length:333 start_codon:yes stop_codon:yes gene_type:complete
MSWLGKEYVVSVVFGNDKEVSVNRTFQTQREMYAYFCALDDSDGWLDSEQVVDGQDGWVKNSDGTWKHIDPEYDEVDIETCNQKAWNYTLFEKKPEPLSKAITFQDKEQE